MDIFVVSATLWIRISANGKILLMSPPLTREKWQTRLLAGHLIKRYLFVVTGAFKPGPLPGANCRLSAGL
jgi:hypothetical protein